MEKVPFRHYRLKEISRLGDIISGMSVTSEQLRVLVVDDDELNRRMMRLLLAREDHDIHVAASGLEALDAIKSLEFDLVLMDLQMPEMDGIETSRRIREWEGEGRHTYIVALTASFLPEKGRELFEAGIDNYISKPFEVEHLRQMMRYGLDHRRLDPQIGAAQDATNTPAGKPDVDYNRGIRQVGGDEGIYRELLGDFIKELPEKLETLQSHYERGDLEALSRAAHNLKGVSSNLGALQLSEYAANLEKQSGGSYTDSLKSLLDETRRISQKLMESASDFLTGTGVYS
ncbi:MAG: hypothetical protein C3F07_05165 [Anaerolineales bacterium]|nr:response regulator [Anaerolineae bacterium]PWB75725.1 MAG: hypothetical protein C3F07_05165 [Anaerolineales bacterium]